MPKLSIITINYNNPDGLRLTIKSVISQKYTNYEWIVIDGGSGSSDLDIIKQYSNLFKYWKSEPDNGIYHAMNKGTCKAQGEYCFFLNSGDTFVNEEVLQKVFAKEVKEDVIFGNLLVMLNNKVVGKSRGKEKLSFLDIYIGLVKHQAAFIRRDLFDKFDFYNEELKIVADWEFFLKTVGLGDASYKYIDIDISYFDNNGISNNSENLVSEERNIVIDKYIPSMMQYDYETLQKIGIYKVVTRYKIPHFFLRLMTKGIREYEKRVYKK